MKKLLFLGACLLALSSSPVRAQTGGSDVVVVRLVDGLPSSQLVIVRGPGQNEQLELPAGIGTKNLISSGEVLQQAVAKLYQEGYTLKSTFSSKGGSAATLIFTKEK